MNFKKWPPPEAVIKDIADDSVKRLEAIKARSAELNVELDLFLCGTCRRNEARITGHLEPVDVLKRVLLVVLPPERCGKELDPDIGDLSSWLAAITTDYPGPLRHRPIHWLFDVILRRWSASALKALPARFILQTPGSEREVTPAEALASPARGVHVSFAASGS